MQEKRLLRIQPKFLLHVQCNHIFLQCLCLIRNKNILERIFFGSPFVPEKKTDQFSNLFIVSVRSILFIRQYARKFI